MVKSGPRSGCLVVEFEGKGPAPLCGMLLGDMGADVIRVERPATLGDHSSAESGFSIIHRNRRTISLDLRQENAKEAALKVPRSYDVRRTPLPLSAVGKVQKNLLRDEWLARWTTV